MRIGHHSPTATTSPSRRLTLALGVIFIVSGAAGAEAPERTSKQWVVDPVDVVPHTLKWVIGMGHAHPSHLQDGRSEQVVAAAVEAMRRAGLRGYKKWLSDRLSEEWVDEKENPPPAFDHDPFSHRRFYQEVIKQRWEPSIATVLEQPWAPTADLDVLDRFCVEGLIHPPRDFPFDRELALSVIYDRIFGMPNFHGPDNDYLSFHGYEADYDGFSPDLREPLLVEVRRILKDGAPPKEEFLAAAIVTSTKWEGETATNGDLLRLIAREGKGSWRWAFHTLITRGERAMAIQAITKRPESDQLEALKSLTNGWAGREALPDLEVQLWKRLFEKSPMKTATSLQHSPARSHLADEARAYLWIESKERKLVNHEEHWNLMALIRIVDSFEDPKDTALIEAFADHPQWRPRGLDNPEKEYWIRDRVAYILKRRSMTPEEKEKVDDPDDPFSDL